MTGGLFDPLGKDRADPDPGASRPLAAIIVAAMVLATLATLLAVAYIRDDGDRGRPVAVTPIEHVAPRPSPPAAPPAPAPPAAAAPSDAPPAASGLPPVRDDQEVEIQNGVRIVRPRRDMQAPGGRRLRVPDAQVPP